MLCMFSMLRDEQKRFYYYLPLTVSEVVIALKNSFLTCFQQKFVRRSFSDLFDSI